MRHYCALPSYMGQYIGTLIAEGGMLLSFNRRPIVSSKAYLTNPRYVNVEPGHECIMSHVSEASQLHNPLGVEFIFVDEASCVLRANQYPNAAENQPK